MPELSDHYDMEALIQRLNNRPLVPADRARAIQRGTIDSGSVWSTATRPRRNGHREPVTPEVQAKYEAWKERMEKHIAYGERNGWVSFQEFDYEPPRGDWVWDETEAEFSARVTDMGGDRIEGYARGGIVNGSSIAIDPSQLGQYVTFNYTHPGPLRPADEYTLTNLNITLS
jgi:hypothetical protein